MIRNYPAVTTLIRNRLNEKDRPFEEKIHWFHEKGVSVLIEDENLYTLKTEVDGHHSELTQICQRGLIYRGLNVICFMGENLKEIKLQDLTNYKGIEFSEKTLYIEDIRGRSVYMFYDPKIKNWNFADNKNSISRFKKQMMNTLYNIQNVDPAFTYHFKIVDSGENQGIYLVSMVQTINCKYRTYSYILNHCIRLKVESSNIFKFEGLDKLEESDLPILAEDELGRRIRIIQ